jgi:DNA modification methylase
MADERIFVFNRPVAWHDFKFTTIWRVPPTSHSGHPCAFPLELPVRLIKSFTDPGAIILDPYCGSGTTCVAAKKLGRKYIGIDRSEEYCQIARDRLEAVDSGVPVQEARKGQMAMFG